jgi:hypothetical protein
MTKPAASITHERSGAAWGGRTILKPAGVAGTLVQVTGVRAEALRPRPAPAHGRGRKPWTDIELRTKFVRPAGMTKTDLLQAGFSPAWFGRAILGLNVGSAEQEANSRARRQGCG